MNSTAEMSSKIALLETQVDMLETELSYLDQLLMKCGFSCGIETLKAAVEEFLVDEPS